MTIQWGLAAGNGNNALANFGMGVQLGQNFQDRRDQREQSNALLDLRRQQEERLRAQQEQQQAQQQQQQRRANIGDVAKLFDGVNEQNYGQRIALAQQMGLDVSGVPQQFDPAWIEQQQAALRFFSERPEAISDAGKKAIDAGFEPGTPEFEKAVRQIITAGMAQPYTGSQGETRLYTPDVFGGGGQVQGGVPFDPNEWEVVEQGGPQVAPAGGFPGY